uniref:BSD domain-containing protein n=1 Tax=Anguilla anguilla TaxID=7936 RepID=A0A0E9R037_ANGAN
MYPEEPQVVPSAISYHSFWRRAEYEA